jgi:inosine-uridine nucleoside N-ribohydrolase
MKGLTISFFYVLIFFIFFACTDIIKAESKVPVIFDTDLGNDVDDIMALQMLYNFENMGDINLIGITISKSNPYTIQYIDGYNRFNKRFKIPLGYIYDGPNKDDGKYLRQTLDTIIDGKKILFPHLSISDSLPQAYMLQRKLLSEQRDSSVIFIVVGPNTNIRRLLESGSDKYSKLSGVELVRKKVKLLVMMGGNFEIPSRNFPEWNIIQDIQASQIMFANWPTKIVASGYEVGQKLLFPHQSILNDLPYSYKHPLAVSYKLFQKMPYDRQTWDLTAVLYAINQESNYFDISEPGNISIDEKGSSLFTPSKYGKHFYLSIKDNQIPVTLKALIHAVTGDNN